MRTFGLIGKKLEHSFSAQYFNEKFQREGINDTEYKNFELNNINDFQNLIERRKFSGLNVTIPYKESIIPFLDTISYHATKIGAVNTIQFINNKTIGHNTDYIGFKKSISPLLKGLSKALILGNGGAGKAVKYALNQLNVKHKTVSRGSSFDYKNITKEYNNLADIIINTTPLGTYPKTDDYPKIPYEKFNRNQLFFDLIYNPQETLFLKYGKANKCKIKNGLEMLQIQAEESWNIWNQKVVKY